MTSLIWHHSSLAITSQGGHLTFLTCNVILTRILQDSKELIFFSQNILSVSSYNMEKRNTCERQWSGCMAVFSCRKCQRTQPPTPCTIACCLNLLLICNCRKFVKFYGTFYSSGKASHYGMELIKLNCEILFEVF